MKKMIAAICLFALVFCGVFQIRLSARAADGTVSYQLMQSPDGKTLTLKIYLDNCIGAASGTVAVEYSGVAFQYAQKGADADLVNDAAGNSFVGETNDTNPNKVYYGFYFKESLWEQGLFQDESGKSLDIDSDHFHVASFIFSKNNNENLSLSVNVNMRDVYGDTISKSFQIGCSGDVDGDGEITSGDARLALRASVKLENYQPDSRAFFAADVNRDGTIGSDDARSILRASVKIFDAEFIVPMQEESTTVKPVSEIPTVPRPIWEEKGPA